MKVLEAAGDIFFNSRQDRHKAIHFYRVQRAHKLHTGIHANQSGPGLFASCVLQDRAMPLAEQSSSLGTRLRLCNKLTELMLDLKMFGEAVEFAHVALDISITLGTLMTHFSAFTINLAPKKKSPA